MTGTLKGRYIIDRQLKSAFKAAKSRIDILTTDQGLSDLYSKHFRVLKKIARSGIKLRILSNTTDNSITSAFTEIADLKRLAQPAGRIAIIDGQSMLMSLTDDKDVHETQDIALWATSEHAINSMAAPLFSQLWGKAK
ncbi:MAG: hypothetical protein JRI49_04910 [Deltaproteobacteria bacterium]|nr:hypothetical protein [Deltaproteobacteria bacterium]